LSDVKTYAIHGLAKWFAHPWREVAVTRAGVVLHDRKAARNIGWAQLSSPPAFKPGLFFDAVILTEVVNSKSTHKTHTIGWLCKRDARAFKAEIDRGWYGYHSGSASKSVERIQRYLHQCGYLRDSQWLQVKTLAQQAFKR